MELKETFEERADSFVENHPNLFLSLCAVFGTAVGVGISWVQYKMLARLIVKEVKKQL